MGEHAPAHDPATRAKADALAPDGFLKKPFMPDHLLALLDRLGEGEVDSVG